MATCRGVDVSVYQGVQNWDARRAEGVAFAFAKASEGQRTHDAHFATHITGIKQAGLVPGAYHFAWPCQDVALEAANYVAAVRPYAGRGFVHWLDLERRSDGANYKGCTAAGILAWVTKWLKLVADAFPGQRVGVYTSGSDLAAGHVPAGTTIWYPAYTWGYTAVGYDKAEAATRPKPSGWTPLLWQFTSTPIDRSICYLSEAALRAWAQGTTEETDMQLSDLVKLGTWVPKKWPADTGLQDGTIQVNTALGSAYGYSRVAAESSTALLAQVAALTATVGKLAEGGGLDAAEIQAAAQAGAQAALDKLADAINKEA
jgi:GH25 family lysozyme M1 (1,4-beta-N-acetylmuramidase)